MASSKKKRSQPGVSAANPRSYSQLYKGDNRVSQVAASTEIAVVDEAAPKPSIKSSDSIDWNKEYAYVFRDLRMLAIVSAALFGLIIVAGFFI